MRRQRRLRDGVRGAAAVLPAACLAAAVSPAPAQDLQALSTSPTPGSVHTTGGYCLAPDVHDRIIETLLNEGEAAAADAYDAAKIMGACKRRQVRAEYLRRTYRFDWPGRPRFVGEQWLIRMQDSGRTAHILIMVRQGEG